MALQALPTRILLIDDDLGTREIVPAALRREGFRVATAASGVKALEIVRSSAVDVIVVDLQLPDISGTDVIRSLGDKIANVPFVVLSGFLTTAATVEAMKLGAFDVLEKPVALADLVAVLHRAVSKIQRSRAERPKLAVAFPEHPRMTSRPGSITARWATYVLKACESEGDLKTLRQWATVAGISYSSLRETCRLVDMRPHDARDMARVLRAVIRSFREGCRPEALLDVSDERTLKILLRRAGLHPRSQTSSMSVDRFFQSQRFVSADNEAVRTLRRLLLARAGQATLVP